MIQSNELRIGNYVFDDDLKTICVVSRIETKEYIEWNSGDDYNVVCLVKNTKDRYLEGEFEPIRLSEEILLKCGFDYNESYLQYKHPKCPIYFTKHPRNKTLLCFIHNCTNGNTRFLHDLQNLYFALTGTELEINL
jgi:hypothetical protein